MNLVEKALAQTLPTIGSNDTGEGTTIQDFLISVINGVIIPIAAAIAVLYLVYSGILYLTAAGNPDAAKKGQQGVVNAIIGIIVIALAYLIVRVVAGTASTVGTTT